MFILDERLVNESFILGRFKLSLLLLAKDANYPWCILVPERENMFELYHLDDTDRKQFFRESNRLSEVMSSRFNADKMNVAALGNVVKQLHIHHIARFTDDTAWPQPIWGACPAKEYTAELLKVRRDKLTAALMGSDFTAFPEDYTYLPSGPNSEKIDC